MTKAVAGLCMGCMLPLDGNQTCPHCGYNVDTGYDKNYIKPGTVLSSRYIVGRLVHQNGESARYIGYDNSTQNSVWIDEYFPHTIAQRGEETANVLPLQGHGAQYKAHMSDFLDICNDVKRLSITEPVVPIENVISENNTIYAIYKDLDMVPLESYIQEQGGHLPLDHAMELLLPLLNTIGNMHAHGQIHRGLSPHTIYIDTAGKLYLWDFALAATRTAGCELEAELFSGYSAPEQYSPSGWQGAWTDVYAIAALIYRTLSGVVPPKATLIGAERFVMPLDDLVMGLPKNVADAVSNAMNPRTEDRTQAVATLSAQLLQSDFPHTTVYDTNKVARSRNGRSRRTYNDDMDYTLEQDPISPRQERGFSAKYVILALFLTVVVLMGFIVFFMYAYYPELVPSGNTSQSEEESQEEDPVEDGDEDTLPRFVGRNVNDVLDNSRYTGVYNFKVEYENSEDWGKDIIMDQTPTEGTDMPGGGTVTLKVSKGTLTLTMPDLTGLDEESARRLLDTLNADSEEKLQVQVMTRYDSTAEPGTVVNTTPGAGTEFDPKRQVVVIFLSPEAEESSEEESSEEESSKEESSREESSKPESSQQESSQQSSKPSQDESGGGFVFTNPDGR